MIDIVVNKPSIDYDTEWQTPSKGKRVARFTVGTSTAGWTADQVDYLCDGTADQVEINAAITALPAAGGEVVILDGTYNCTNPILINKNNVTLSGNGAGTILKKSFYGSSDNPGLIYITSSNNTVKFLFLLGYDYDYWANTTIYLSGGSYNTIAFNIFEKGYNGIYQGNSSYNIIIGNIIRNCSDAGIDLAHLHSYGGSYTIVASNVCTNNKHGISMSWGYSNEIIGNTCINNTTGIDAIEGNKSSIIGNVCNDNSYGMRVNCDMATVTGNVCNNNNCGILLGCEEVTIVGNTCIRGSGDSSDYTAEQYTIRTTQYTKNSLIACNNIMGKNYVNEGTNNTFVNNKYN